MSEIRDEEEEIRERNRQRKQEGSRETEGGVEGEELMKKRRDEERIFGELRGNEDELIS